MSRVDLSGRVAVVTGAGTGIGARIAVRLAEAGADLALHYKDDGPTPDAAVGTCTSLGRRVTTIPADFAVDPSKAADVVRLAVERLGGVDILVNNAAVTSKGEQFESHSRSLFEEVLAVNLTAPFLAAQAAANHMIAVGRGGRIINISSVHTRVSRPGLTAYEVSKGGLDALTFSAAVALGRHGITVNSVAPGAVLVERYKAVPHFDEAWFVSRTPVGRLGRPDDIAAAVLYLASDDAGFLTGQTIFIDGGLTRQSPLVR
jgi:3-oxoacyl-[acyl-carrier protein] reductase